MMFKKATKEKKKIDASNNCIDCIHCKVWITESSTASCLLYFTDNGFSPDRPVPVKCIDKVNRKK